MDNTIKLQGKENLSERANKFLFLELLNDIDSALNGAREAAEIKPTIENVELLRELEAFYTTNAEYYAEAKRVFNNNINQH